MKKDGLQYQMDYLKIHAKDKKGAVALVYILKKIYLRAAVLFVRRL